MAGSGLEGRSSKDDMIRSDGVDEASNSYRPTTQHAGHVAKSRLLIKMTGQVDVVEPVEVLGGYRR